MMIAAFLLDGTPDTTGYMLAGFAVIFGFMLVYVVSLAVRKRRLSREEEMLKELEEGEKK